MEKEILKESCINKFSKNNNLSYVGISFSISTISENLSFILWIYNLDQMRVQYLPRINV